MTSKYISTTDTAKLIRAELKKAFPGMTFSVRSRKYAGGSSIDVEWDDGPRVKDVDKVVGKFEGSRFDGMQDLKISNKNPYLVDYVMTHRQTTEYVAMKEEATEIINFDCFIEEGERFGGERVEELAGRVARDIDLYNGETIQAAVERIVIRRDYH